ncbi:MAG: alpha/beta hydrolase [Desulfobacteraceae bacterium]|nr:alpha/beta hydrolase [Desulfobacteraceae bacterium]
MTTETIEFTSDKFTLEGILDKNDVSRAVVVTHPHPLYGGDMHNPVTGSIHTAYASSGYTTLRFNFRGVGASQGTYAKGTGEQGDVLSAVGRLRDMGAQWVEIAGYSFGAWVNALAVANGAAVDRLIMVSPPVGFLDFDGVGELDGLHLVITGSKDEIAPPDVIKKYMPEWNPRARLEVITGADHFYGSYFPTLESTIINGIK